MSTIQPNTPATAPAKTSSTSELIQQRREAIAKGDTSRVSELSKEIDERFNPKETKSSAAEWEARAEIPGTVEHEQALAIKRLVEAKTPEAKKAISEKYYKDQSGGLKSWETLATETRNRAITLADDDLQRYKTLSTQLQALNPNSTDYQNLQAQLNTLTPDIVKENNMIEIAPGEWVTKEELGDFTPQQYKNFKEGLLNVSKAIEEAKNELKTFKKNDGTYDVLEIVRTGNDKQIKAASTIFGASVVEKQKSISKSINDLYDYKTAGGYDVALAVSEGIPKKTIDTIYGAGAYDDIKETIKNKVHLKTGDWVDSTFYNELPEVDQKEINNSGVEKWAEATFTINPHTGDTYRKSDIINNWGTRSQTGHLTGDIDWNKFDYDTTYAAVWDAIGGNSDKTTTQILAGAKSNAAIDAFYQAKKEYDLLPSEAKEIYRNKGIDGVSQWYNDQVTRYNLSDQLLKSYDYNITQLAIDAEKNNIDPETVRVALSGSGISASDIDKAIDYAAKQPKSTWSKMWQGMTPWDEAAGDTANLKNVVLMGTEFFPGVYTAKYWDDLSLREKIIGIALDALILAPYVAGVSRAARASTAITKLGRLKAGLKAIPEIAIAEVTTPYNAVRHPVRTSKYLAQTVGDIVSEGKSLLPFTKRFSDVAVSQSLRTQRLPIAIAGGADEAKKITDILIDEVIRTGKTAVYIDKNGVKYTLRPSLVSGQLGGSLVHTSNDINELMQGVEVAFKPGMTAKEQGLFMSHETTPRFWEESAFGFKAGEKLENEITKELRAKLYEAIKANKGSKALKLAEDLEKEIGRIRAEKIALLEKEAIDAMAIGNWDKVDKIGDMINSLEYRPTHGSLYYGGEIKGGSVGTQKIFRKVAEVEKKSPVGVDLPAAKSIYKTRISGKEGQIALTDKDLTFSQRLKIKMRTPLERFKQIYTPPLEVKGAKIVKNYDEADEYMRAASKAESSGNYNKAAALRNEANGIRAERMSARLDYIRAVQRGGNVAASLRAIGSGLRIIGATNDRLLLETANGTRVQVPQPKRGPRITMAPKSIDGFVRAEIPRGENELQSKNKPIERDEKRGDRDNVRSDDIRKFRGPESIRRGNTVKDIPRNLTTPPQRVAVITPPAVPTGYNAPGRSQRRDDSGTSRRIIVGMDQATITKVEGIPDPPIGKITQQQGRLKINGKLRPVWRTIDLSQSNLKPGSKTKIVYTIGPPVAPKKMASGRPIDTVFPFGGNVPDKVTTQMGFVETRHERRGTTVSFKQMGGHVLKRHKKGIVRKHYQKAKIRGRGSRRR